VRVSEHVLVCVQWYTYLLTCMMCVYIGGEEECVKAHTVFHAALW